MATGCDWHKGWIGDEMGYCDRCHTELVPPIADPEAKRLFIRLFDRLNLYNRPDTSAGTAGLLAEANRWLNDHFDKKTLKELRS